MKKVMKLINRMEKSKEFWFLIGISFLFFLLRLPSLIEPYWYGDEAVYELIGLAMNNGRALYSQIWDNKPPLLYLVYAFSNADQFTVRFISLIFAILSIIIFYFLSKKLFVSEKARIAATMFYVFFFATPVLEGNIANAENFMLLPAIAGGFLIYTAAEKIHTRKKLYLILFFAGLLLSLAFLFKIVAIFDFAAFFAFLVFVLLPERFLIKKLAFYTLGFLIPIALTILYFFIQGSVADFIQATFSSNIAYVGYKNKFIIAQGFLILKLILLFIAIAFVFLKRKIVSRQHIFILLWFFFSVFNVFFSGRKWPHYLLVLLPSAALMLGIMFGKKNKETKIFIAGLLFIVFYAITVFLKINTGVIEKMLRYYQNFALFIFDQKSLSAYQEYFDIEVTRDYEVARYIANKIHPNDVIFVWGNNPQIYVLSNTLPPGKYTVEYHINQSPKAIAETAEDMSKSKPKYIIILSKTSNYPYSLGAYINKFNLEGANIYERTF